MNINDLAHIKHTKTFDVKTNQYVYTIERKEYVQGKETDELFELHYPTGYKDYIKRIQRNC
ncbi:MAG: hypothetical protein WAX79_08620 [Candidatus Omnitrophota bacterium]